MKELKNMNIFVLDKDPVIAAQLQCDKHVVKMVTESAQMLSTVHRVLDGVPTKKPSKSGKTMRKYYDLFEGQNDLEMETLLMSNVHERHPCTVWSAETTANYDWHWEHLKALCEEYTYRYCTEKEPFKMHKVERIDPLIGISLLGMLKTHPRNLPKGPLTEFPLAMKSNPECMYDGDPVRSYKQFYQTKQERFKMAWTRRSIPEWFVQKEAVYG
jgi:hypothetical protein